MSERQDPLCLNLLEAFGQRYRVGFDPAYQAQGKHRAGLDPWMMLIPCRFGVILPWTETELLVEVEGHRRRKAELARLDCCRLYQDGDDFGSFVFPVDAFDQVAEIVRPSRRRQISDVQRQRLVEAGARYRFGSGDRCELGDEIGGCQAEGGQSLVQTGDTP